MIKSILFPVFLGLLHCFEADHVLAVASVSNADSKLKLHFLKGVTWGIGHSIPIILIGCTFVLFEIFLLKKLPFSLEAIVGIVLIAAGVYKLATYSKTDKITDNHFKAMLLIGLLHGLAGSAGVILAHSSTEVSITKQLLYFLEFSIGSIIGMGIIGLFIGKVEGWFKYIKKIQWLLPIITIGYGIFMIYKFT